MPAHPHHDMIVIGASLGGIEAISKLLGKLTADLPASLFIVQHVSPESPGLLAEMLDRLGPVPIESAKDGAPIRVGRGYVAPPDNHRLIYPGTMRVVRGPRENFWRPAVDPLFRSAAIAYGTRVVAVVLTGLLHDGTAGLLAVKRCGGKAIVQDPADAAYSEMPLRALAAVEPDYRATLAEIPALLDRLARSPAANSVPVPADIAAEARIMEAAMTHINSNESFGPLSELTCPECGGALRRLDDEQQAAEAFAHADQIRGLLQSGIGGSESGNPPAKSA